MQPTSAVKCWADQGQIEETDNTFSCKAQAYQLSQPHKCQRTDKKDQRTAETHVDSTNCQNDNHDLSDEQVLEEQEEPHIDHMSVKSESDEEQMCRSDNAVSMTNSINLIKLTTIDETLKKHLTIISASFKDLQNSITSDKASCTHNLKSLSTATLTQQSQTDSDDDVELVFHKLITENISCIKDNENNSTSTADELLTSVKLTVTEHLHEKGRWKRCARLFFHNPGNVHADQRICIPGLQTPLYLYQAFEVFIMFEMKMFQREGYNADEMGLEKTIQLLGLICLNCILDEARAEVTTAHRKGDITKHLTWGTEGAPQPSDAQCSSGRKFRIECSCVEDESAAQLLSHSGSNLIVVPAALVPIWLQEASRHLNSENRPVE